MVTIARLLIVLVLIGTHSACTKPLRADDNPPDWRKTGTTREKVDMLVAGRPGTGGKMLDIGFRYQRAFWAAHKGKWRLAEQDIDQLGKLTALVPIDRPGRGHTMKLFRTLNYSKENPRILDAVRSRNLDRFVVAMLRMAEDCNACHKTNTDSQGRSFGWIHIGIPTYPVGDLLLESEVAQ